MMAMLFQHRCAPVLSPHTEGKSRPAQIRLKHELYTHSLYINTQQICLKHTHINYTQITGVGCLELKAVQLSAIKIRMTKFVKLTLKSLDVLWTL